MICLTTSESRLIALEERLDYISDILKTPERENKTEQNIGEKPFGLNALNFNFELEFAINLEFA